MATDNEPPRSLMTDRNLALELVRVTEAAALAASRWIGLGKKNEADGAAVEAMRQAFDAVAIDGTVVIGEGEMDEAPMLLHRRKGRRRRPADGYRGRSAGRHDADRQGRARTRWPPSRWPSTATSCTRRTSTWTRSLSAAGLPHGVVNLDDSVANNLRNLARAKRCDVSDLVACILDRDRHKELIAHCREAGARIMLISDGDVAGVIATAMPDAADRHLSWLRRRAGRGAGGGGAALRRRADAGSAAVRGGRSD